MNNSSDKNEKLSPLKQALIAVEEMQRKLRKINAEKNEPIAVIGLSGRFPKARNIKEYWDLLVNKQDGISEVPKERWEIEKYYDSNPGTPGKMITRYGGFINDFDKFDAQFFGISPREALKMDPQQRLLLQTTWEALEDAGINPEEISGTKAGVFIGISTNDYSIVQNDYANGDLSIIDAYQGSGNASSIAANRLSYFFNLQGPSISVDTACSSSLVSTHLACQSLRNKEANLAIAGGVGLLLSPHASITFSQAQMLAPGGRCRTFDASAEGYVRGEGVGIVILKRLSDAIKSNDNILALIKSSAVNQDGKTNGLTAPNSLSQVNVINEAIKKAKIKPEDIGYIETHGTGTILGDPIEVQALGMVMKNRDKSNPCYLGAAKTNIGHLEAAAGIAGLIKAILVLKNKIIPPNLHFNKINPHIPIDELPFEIPVQPVEWNTGNKKRFAGVSSFGFGGTNAHIILQEADEVKKEKNEIERPKHILCLSAYEKSSLTEIAKRYKEYLTNENDIQLADICYTANTGRYTFTEKVAFPFETKKELITNLNDFIESKENFAIVTNDSKNFEPKKIAFLFTGQGSQYFGMAKELYKTQPIFKKELDTCFEIASKYVSKPLEEIIFNSESLLINETEFTQPALFIIEYSLAKLWMTWGIKPDYLIGHSIGEFVAACIANVFTLEEGIKLTSARGKLMQSLPKNGSMAVIFANEEKVIETLNKVKGEISIAGINGPGNIVISGGKESVQQALDLFTKEETEIRKLNVSHAFHSALMEPILNEFEQIASEVKFGKPEIAIVSNVSGKVIAKDEIPDATYWKNHIRNAVRFYDGMKTLEQLGANVFIEIGPNPVLIGMGKYCIPNVQSVWAPSLKRNNNDWDILLNSLAELYVKGIKIDWKNFDKGYKRYKVQLPTYAFKKERYYVEPKANGINVNNLNNNNLKCLIKENKDTGKKQIRIIDENNNLLLDLDNIDVEDNSPEEIFNAVKQQSIEEKKKIETEEEETFSAEMEMEELLELPSDEKKKIISEKLKSEIGKILKLNPDRIDVTKSITHLGLDSIMAIELKNNLTNKYKISIPVAELIKGPSVKDLTDIILEELEKEEDEETVKLIRGEKRTGDFELSSGQNAMWFQHQMAPESIFNPTYAVKIKSSIDLEKFKNVLSKIIERHDALRTTYHLKDNRPVQRVHEKIELPFTVTDCKQLNVEELDELINKKANEIFNIETGPVFKTHLFELKNDESVFLISAHHIAVDFWSLATIVDEISQLYQAESNVELKTNRYTYIDFTEWQKKFVNSKAGLKQFEYWKNKLSGELPVLDLPTKKIRKPVQTFNGSSFTINLKLNLTEKLKNISEEKNATLYMSLFTVFQILLNKYTHQNDIIVGTPTTGRSMAELENIVGYFVNPLPIRTEIKSNKSFPEILEDVKNNIVGALENQDYPFNLIVEKIQPERDVSRTPVFQVMFVYQKAHVLADEGLSGFAVGMENSTMKLGGLEVESYNIKENKSAFDLTLLTAETSSGITATVTYNTDLFEQKYIERFLSHYEKLISDITNNPDVKISALSLIDRPHNELLNLKYQEYNQYPFVHKQVEQNAIKFPDKIAVQIKNKTLTYSELLSSSNKLANYLLTKKLIKENRIGVFVERSFEMIISLLAIMKAGFVYVPIDTAYPDERINAIIEDAQIDIIISHSKHCNRLKDLVSEVVCLDTDREKIDLFPETSPGIKLDELNLAYSIYTSGSTGKPKGVLLTHKGLSNLVKNQTEIFDITKESIILQLASLSFDASVSEIFTALVNGAILHLVSQDVLLSGTALVNEINERKITVATIPPSLLAVLPNENLSSLKTLVSAGELCTTDVVKKWATGRKFINAYGPTEITVCATTYITGNGKDKTIVPIGTSIKGVNAYILDENLNPVPFCVPGELFISGVGLARGYNNSPAQTAEKFIPNPFSSIPGDRLYATGDLVKLRDDGDLEFLGRIDDQIKFRGFRIELSEIQTVLEKHPEIIKSELLLKKNKNEKKLIAFYVSKNNKEIDRQSLREYVTEHLPEYMMPSIFVKVENIPLTHNGKVNKKALAKIKLNQDVKREYEKPQSTLEKEIVEIWQDVLNIDDISTNDNFFELGGHSLNVIQVQNKMRERFDKDFTVVDFFKYPTVKLLANYLSNGNNLQEQMKEVKQRVDKRKQLLEQKRLKMKNRRN